jgi:hypothetical protein
MAGKAAPGGGSCMGAEGGILPKACEKGDCAGRSVGMG